jgi:hypothetical protein
MNSQPGYTEDRCFAASERQDLAACAAFPDDVCGRNTNLRRRVEERLAAEPKVSRFLESPAVTAPIEPGPVAAEEIAGTVIGPYRLMEQIGEVGMGVVYVAEQTVRPRPLGPPGVVSLTRDGVKLHSVRQAVALVVPGDEGGAQSIPARASRTQALPRRAGSPGAAWTRRQPAWTQSDRLTILAERGPS